MRKNSGFTIYELAVTIAIISVIAALTLPPYLSWWRTSRLQSAVSNLTADLEMAKTRAIRENAFVVIKFHTGSYTIFVDNNKDWDPNNGENILLNRSLPAGVFVDTASLSFPTVNDKLRFNGRGIPFEIVSEEQIRVNQASNNRQIKINRLGKINVQ
ncbi:MAG: GspH/FimT family pseudopilin [Desulfobacterales bacterium]|nr:GspH/FimT family pseudopilin [Desulfobacterales bacterium]